MKENDLILKLISDKRDIILNSVGYKKCLSISELCSKLDIIYENFEKLNILTNEDEKLLDDESKVIIEQIKYFCLLRRADTNEVKERLVAIKNRLYKDSKEVFDSFERLSSSLDNLNSLEDIIVSNGFNNDNYLQVLNFIKSCYDEQRITVEKVIALNSYVVAKCVSIGNVLLDEEEEVIEENEEPIYEELEQLFNKYGYSYNELTSKIREKFNKYAKLDYTEYVLSKLRQYEINQSDLLKNSKTIFRIIIDKNNNTLDQICNFVDQNNCTLSTLLELPNVFHKRKKLYVSNKERRFGTGDGGDNSDGYLSVTGTFDDFMSNVELLKKSYGSFKIDNKFFKKRKSFLNTPTAKIMDNLRVLNLYGICEKGQLPNDLSCLIGNFTAYQLDRFIELGLYDYIKGNTSYLNKTKSPFKSYKIRRGNDLGDTVLYSSGMRMYGKYSNDKEDVNGISLIDDGGKERVVQKRLTPSDLNKIPYENRRSMPIGHMSYENYYYELYQKCYRYQEFTPFNIFSKNSDLGFKTLMNYVINQDDYNNVEFGEDVLEDRYIKILENGFCQGVFDGQLYEYKVKKDDNTYEFRPYKFPDKVIIISRNKVLRLCKLLKDNNLWLKEDIYFDDNINILLTVMTKDSVLNYWEFYYLRNILKGIFGDGMKKIKKGVK